MKKITKSMILVLVLLFAFGGVIHPKSKNTILLNTLGVLSAQGIYLTYIAIGATADGYVKKAYDDKTAKNLLGEYMRVIRVTKNQMKVLLKKRVVRGSDVKFVKQLIITYDYLFYEALGFKTYIDTKEQIQAQRYNKYRKKAWSKISKLLGLK